jgi:hypothetical protein
VSLIKKGKERNSMDEKGQTWNGMKEGKEQLYTFTRIYANMSTYDGDDNDTQVLSMHVWIQNTLCKSAGKKETYIKRQYCLREMEDKISQHLNL